MAPPKITWTKPKPPRTDLILEKAKEFAAENAIAALIRETGIPGVVDAKNPKEDALGLLKLAAEVEHALMVQYLYAGASVRASQGEGAGAANKITTVAVQEMGHLLSVQNLLLSIGGPESCHFGRDSIRASSSDNPIPLVLEPVSKHTLAKYIIAEMPAVIDDQALRERVDALRSKLNPIPLHRVGLIYAKLFWIFQPDDTPVPPLNLSTAMGFKSNWHLKPEDFIATDMIEQFEATEAWIKGSVPHVILEKVHDSDTALALLSKISEQGEGLGSDKDSHFFEFIKLLDLFEDNKLTVTPLPVFELPDPSAGAGTPNYATRWAELMDVRYNLLVLDFWHAIVTPMTEQLRTDLIELAYANMIFLRELTFHVLRLRNEMGMNDAKPSFNLFYENLPQDEAGRRQRHMELLDKQNIVIKHITDDPAFQDCSSGDCEILDFDGNTLVENIEQNDITRKTQVPLQT